MNKFGNIAACMTVILATSHMSIAEVPSDSKIELEIVGSWISPKDSSDYTPGSHNLETFRPDGTYSFYVYENSACKVVIKQDDVKYTIHNGILTTILPNGSTLRDKVESIGDGKMTLHSLEDGTTYTRAKSNTCG